MYPSSCAGSVVSFKTRMPILFRLAVMLVLRAAVNLAHMYPVSGVVAERVASQTMLPCLTTCRLAMLVRRGLWLHQCRINFPLQLPAGVYPLLRFKTRMPINVRLDFGLVLRAAVVNLAQNPLLSFCRPVLLGGSLPLSSRIYLLVPVASATLHRMRL